MHFKSFRRFWWKGKQKYIIHYHIQSYLHERRAGQVIPTTFSSLITRLLRLKRVIMSAKGKHKVIHLFFIKEKQTCSRFDVSSKLAQFMLSEPCWSLAEETRSNPKVLNAEDDLFDKKQKENVGPSVRTLLSEQQRIHMYADSKVTQDGRRRRSYLQINIVIVMILTCIRSKGKVMHFSLWQSLP